MRPGQNQMWAPAMLVLPFSITGIWMTLAYLYPVAAGVVFAVGGAAWVYSRRAPAKIENAPTVIIVGFGFSGLDMAIKCKQRGIPFTVFEKSPQVGGVWWDNQYPGVACDVFSHAYSFSYELNPWWSRSFAEGPEIRAYMDRMAKKYGVAEHVHFGHEMVSARWSEEKSEWEVDIKSQSGTRTHSAQVFLPAVGLFHAPRWPDGIKVTNFAGDLIHTRAWKHSFDATGKTVAVMGTGASAIQMIPRLAEKAKHLYVFQRTPSWIIPKQDFDYPTWVKYVFAYVPGVMFLHRLILQINMESFSHFVFNTESKSKWIPKLTARAMRSMMTKQVANLPREARENMVPDYLMGCKRAVISAEYLQTFERPNVTLVPRPIESVDATGVKAKDGDRYEVDALVCATGFDMLHHPASEIIIGRSGKPLSTLYGRKPLLYLAMAAHDFPNLFVLFGPGALVPPSGIAQIERQTGYVCEIISELSRRGVSTVELKKDVGDEYFEQSQARLKRTVLNTCTSYYKTPEGVIWTHTPGGSVENWWIHRKPVLEHYVFARARSCAAP